MSNSRPQPHHRLHHLLITVFGLAAVILLVPLSGEHTRLGARPESGDGLPQDPFVVRVYYDNIADLEELQRYDLWEYNNLKEQYVLLSLDRAGYEEMEQQGWQITVDTAATNQLRQRAPLFFYGGYRTVDELYGDLAAVNASYPHLTELVNYGDSYCRATGGCTTLGGEFHPGFELKVIRVTNEAIPGASQISGRTITQGTKPIFFLMANIHAREITTPELAMRMLSWLIDGYGTKADATWLVDWHEIWIVPTANPDGHWLVELGEQAPYNGAPFFQRKNANNDADADDAPDCPQWPPGSFSQYGIDLNRNHSFGWGPPGSSVFPCDQTFRGPSAASEIEVAQLESLVRTLIADQRGEALTDPAPPDTTGLFITLHSFSELVLWPWGHTTTPAPNRTDLKAIGDKFATYNNYLSCQPTICLYGANGASDDWAYGELGVPAFTFEVGTSFMPPLSEVDNVQWPDNGPAFQYAAKIARTPYLTVHGPDTRDMQTTAAADGTTITVTAVIADTNNGNQPIAGAEFSVDIPFWVPGTPTTSTAAIDGTFDETEEAVMGVIDVSSLSAGRHILLMHGRDAEGNWGAPTAHFFIVEDVGPAEPEIELTKTADHDTTEPGDVISYTIRHSITFTDTHSYSLSLIDTLPVELTIRPDTIQLNGVTEPTLYQAATHSILVEANGTLADEEMTTITFQAEVKLDTADGTVILNEVETTTIVGENAPQTHAATTETTVNVIPPSPFNTYLPIVNED